ncbi:hypothetical protein BDQ17DRAFT_1407166 [Cyathus striatus]|nr:hypothetical protein BDQ17DRAFT_1407166 [Cyathus striatus]
MQNPPAVTGTRNTHCSPSRRYKAEFSHFQATFSSFVISMQHTIITRETLVRRVIELSKHIPQETTIDTSKHSGAANGAAMLTLELVREASNACPAVPLQAVSSIALVLLDTAQTAKGNKKNLLRLASNSLEISYVILSHYHNKATGEWKSDIPKDHTDMIFRFVEQAYSVYLEANTLRSRPWFKRFFAAKLDVDTIREFRETLDHARHVFALETLLETNRDARELRQIVPAALSPPSSPVSPKESEATSPTMSPTTPELLTAIRPFSYPPTPSSGGGPSTYISIGGDYSTVDRSVRNEKLNSENRWNFEIKNACNDEVKA